MLLGPAFILQPFNSSEQLNLIIGGYIGRLVLWLGMWRTLISNSNPTDSSGFYWNPKSSGFWSNSNILCGLVRFKVLYSNHCNDNCWLRVMTDIMLLVIPDNWIYNLTECWLLLIIENGLNSSTVNNSFFAMQLILVLVQVPCRIDLQAGSITSLDMTAFAVNTIQYFFELLENTTAFKIRSQWVSEYGLTSPSTHYSLIMVSWSFLSVNVLAFLCHCRDFFFY